MNAMSLRFAVCATLLATASASAGCGGADSRQSTPERHTANSTAVTGGYRFVKVPIAVFLTGDPAYGENYRYRVSFRMNKALRRRGSDIFATVTLGGAGGGAGLLRIGNHAHHCYTQLVDFDPPEFGTPRPGLRVTVRMRVPGAGRLTAVVPLLDKPSFRTASRKLSCGRGPLDAQP